MILIDNGRDLTVEGGPDLTIIQFYPTNRTQEITRFEDKKNRSILPDVSTCGPDLRTPFHRSDLSDMELIRAHFKFAIFPVRIWIWTCASFRCTSAANRTPSGIRDTKSLRDASPMPSRALVRQAETPPFAPRFPCYWSTLTHFPRRTQRDVQCVAAKPLPPPQIHVVRDRATAPSS